MTPGLCHSVQMTVWYAVVSLGAGVGSIVDRAETVWLISAILRVQLLGIALSD